MKTATIPSLRVDPELRQAAESVLHQDESLSSFVEASLRANVAHRQMQNEFLARGLRSQAEARLTGEYYDAAEVHARLESKLKAAKAGKSGR